MSAKKLIMLATAQCLRRIPLPSRPAIRSAPLDRLIRFRIAGALMLLATWAVGLVFAQAPAAPPDLSGEWRRLTSHEDAHERGGGPDPGEYWGLPVNDAERMRA